MLPSATWGMLIATFDSPHPPGGMDWAEAAGGGTRTTAEQGGTYPNVTILCYPSSALAVATPARQVLHFEVRPMPNLPTNVPMGEELERYLQEHPAARDYLRKFEQAQAVFGGYLRLAQPHIVLRELDGGSNIDVDPNAAISRTNT